MPAELNHTIVHVRDAAASAAFITEMFDLPAPARLGHFTIVQVGPTSLDLLGTDEPIASRHFAVLVDDAAFDSVMARIAERNIPYWADPFRREPQAINRFDDGRGVYFDDPAGHQLEAITRPYGSGGCEADHPNPLLRCP